MRRVRGAARTAEPCADAHTVAFGITVPKPLGDFLMLDAVATTGGTRGRGRRRRRCSPRSGELARDEGRASARRARPCFAAVRQLRESGWLGESDEVVVLNTGAGIKYPDTVAADPPVLQPGDAIPH